MSIAQVITRWTPFTTNPIIGTSNYPENIDVRNQEMASRMVEIDSIGQEIDAVGQEVNIKAIAVDGNTQLTAQNATNAGQSAIEAQTLRNEVMQMKSEISNSQNIVNAFTNIDFGGFSINDGDLIVDYFDNAYSVPSLVDGEFIITY